MQNKNSAQEQVVIMLVPIGMDEKDAHLSFLERLAKGVEEWVQEVFNDRAFPRMDIRHVSGELRRRDPVIIILVIGQYQTYSRRIAEEPDLAGPVTTPHTVIRVGVLVELIEEILPDSAMRPDAVLQFRQRNFHLLVNILRNLPDRNLPTSKPESAAWDQ